MVFSGEMVTRSVFVPVGEDTFLRQVSHEMEVTRLTLICSAVSSCLRDWKTEPKEDVINLVGRLPMVFSEEFVTRSVHLRMEEDGFLRELSHELGVSKSELLRAALSSRLEEWKSGKGPDAIRRDLDAARVDVPVLSAEGWRS